MSIPPSPFLHLIRPCYFPSPLCYNFSPPSLTQPLPSTELICSSAHWGFHLCSWDSKGLSVRVPRFCAITMFFTACLQQCLLAQQSLHQGKEQIGLCCWNTSPPSLGVWPNNVYSGATDFSFLFKDSSRSSLLKDFRKAHHCVPNFSQGRTMAKARWEAFLNISRLKRCEI